MYADQCTPAPIPLQEEEEIKRRYWAPVIPEPDEYKNKRCSNHLLGCNQRPIFSHWDKLSEIWRSLSTAERKLILKQKKLTDRDRFIFGKLEEMIKVMPDPMEYII